jgi:hypothetical protein
MFAAQTPARTIDWYSHLSCSPLEADAIEMDRSCMATELQYILATGGEAAKPK